VVLTDCSTLVATTAMTISSPHRRRKEGTVARTRVAVDVGGTFTDICVLDEESGAVRVAKVPSTPDPMEGVLMCVEEAGIDLRDVAVCGALEEADVELSPLGELV
jgi:hypothetical protein